MNLTIRRADQSDAEWITAILQAAFGPVASQFGLTRENCPSHASFATANLVRQQMDRCVQIFLGMKEGMPVACVALRMQSGKSAKMKRLAVLPESQGLGIGQQLVAHAESVVRRKSFVAVEIGIIAGHGALIEWYRRKGYVETHQAVFPQLPFAVQYMTKGLTTGLV